MPFIRQACLCCRTFVSHDGHLHPRLLQGPEALPLSAVLQVAEVEACNEDPQAQVGHLGQEVGQAARTLGARGPGTEPGDGVAHPHSPRTGIPQARTQRSQVSQKQKLDKVGCFG